MLRELTAVPSQRRPNGPGRPPRLSAHALLGVIALAGLLLIGLSALRLADIIALVSVPTAMFLCVYLSCTTSAARILAGPAGWPPPSRCWRCSRSWPSAAGRPCSPSPSSPSSPRSPATARRLSVGEADGQLLVAAQQPGAHRPAAQQASPAARPARCRGRLPCVLMSLETSPLAAAVPGLVRSDPHGPGITRVRDEGGFRYLDPSGARSPTPPRWTGSGRCGSRPPGRTSGSRRIRSATSRPRAPTARTGSSTSTTGSGGSSATPRSSGTCSGSPTRCPGCGRPPRTT